MHNTTVFPYDTACRKIRLKYEQPESRLQVSEKIIMNKDFALFLNFCTKTHETNPCIGVDRVLPLIAGTCARCNFHFNNSSVMDRHFGGFPGPWVLNQKSTSNKTIFFKFREIPEPKNRGHFFNFWRKMPYNHFKTKMGAELRMNVWHNLQVKNVKNENRVPP